MQTELIHKLFLIDQLTSNAFLKDVGHEKNFNPYGVQLKFTEFVSFAELEKLWVFFLKPDLIENYTSN